MIPGGGGGEERERERERESESKTQRERWRERHTQTHTSWSLLPSGEREEGGVRVWSLRRPLGRSSAPRACIADSSSVRTMFVKGWFHWNTTLPGGEGVRRSERDDSTGGKGGQLRASLRLLERRRGRRGRRPAWIRTLERLDCSLLGRLNCHAASAKRAQEKSASAVSISGTREGGKGLLTQVHRRGKPVNYLA
eukprot:3708700-Rhodomonas_salina.6